MLLRLALRGGICLVGGVDLMLEEYAGSRSGDNDIAGDEEDTDGNREVDGDRGGCCGGDGEISF